MPLPDARYGLLIRWSLVRFQPRDPLEQALSSVSSSSTEPFVSQTREPRDIGHPIGGVIVFALEGVGVDRQSRPHVRVTQNLLGTLRRHTGFGHQGTRKVAQIVEADRRKTCLAQSSVQDVSQQLVGVDGATLPQLINSHNHMPADPTPSDQRRESSW